MEKNKRIVIIIIVVILLVVIGITGWKIFANKDNNTGDVNPYRDTIHEEDDKIQKEKPVGKTKATEIFNNIPKIYNEAVEPFSDEFKLYAVMNKITANINEEDDYVFSEEEVDKTLRKIFGPKETLDKMQLTEENIKDSIYYYSTEAKGYTVIPTGFGRIYLDQVLKEVTETDENYYMYSYCMVGEYAYDEESGETKVVIGDKNGEDLVLSFTDEIDSNEWVKEYKDKLSLFRYTLKKDKDNYYITAVEQVN